MLPKVRTWTDLVGQSVHRAVLARTMDTKYLEPLLFRGPPGVGKTSAARLTVAGRLCEQTPKPCGACSECTKVLTGTHGKVSELNAVLHGPGLLETDAHLIVDAVSSASDEFTETLIRQIDRFDPDRLFVFTDQHEPTEQVSSRCLPFRFRPVAPDVIVEHLRPRLPEGTAEIVPQAIARKAKGDLRHAHGLLSLYLLSPGPVEFAAVIGPARPSVAALAAWLKGDRVSAVSEGRKIMSVFGDPALVLQDLSETVAEALADREHPLAGAPEPLLVRAGRILWDTSKRPPSTALALFWSLAPTETADGTVKQVPRQRMTLADLCSTPEKKEGPK